jgi:ABC-2 type transport system permease protein
MFIAAVILLNGVCGGQFGKQEQLLVLVGWLTFIVASDVIQELPGIISEEAQTGTLEQLCITPVSLASLLALRSLAFLLGSGVRGLLAAVILSVFVAPLPAGPALIVIFLISLVGAYGLGFMLAGVALVFKRAEALVGVLLSLMIFLTGALVGLESLGWAYQVSKLLLPLTWGISIIRSTLLDGNLVELPKSTDVVTLSLHSFVYFITGWFGFMIGVWKARAEGTLSHY